MLQLGLGFILGPLLFLVYINDLTDNVFSNMKLYADDSSRFTHVSGVDSTHNQTKKGLETIAAWANQWKMLFNPDIIKQAVEVMFSVKNKKPIHPELIFNVIPVAREHFIKHLGVYLDERWSFAKHIPSA